MTDSEPDLQHADHWEMAKALDKATLLKDPEKLLDMAQEQSRDMIRRLSTSQEILVLLNREVTEEHLRTSKREVTKTEVAFALATALFVSTTHVIIAEDYPQAPGAWLFLVDACFGWWVIDMVTRLWSSVMGPVLAKARINADKEDSVQPSLSECATDTQLLQILNREMDDMNKISSREKTLQEQVDSFQVDFDQLSKTFDSVLDSKKMLQAQNSALSVHIEQRAEAFVKLTSKNNDLQLENQDLRRFKASVGSTAQDQTQIKLDLEEIETLKQETLAAQAEATKTLEEATQKYEEAATSRDEAIEYAKKTNGECAQLKKLMQETRELE